MQSPSAGFVCHILDAAVKIGNIFKDRRLHNIVLDNCLEDAIGSPHVFVCLHLHSNDKLSALALAAGPSFSQTHPVHESFALLAFQRACLAFIARESGTLGHVHVPQLMFCAPLTVVSIKSGLAIPAFWQWFSHSLEGAGTFLQQNLRCIRMSDRLR